MSIIDEEIFKPNSDKSKKQDQTPKSEEKHIEKVVKGTVKTRKQPVGKKFTDTFLSESSSSVKDYLLTDVIIPAVKDTILSVIQNGTEMLFYGNARPSRGRSGNSKVSYSSYYKSDRDRYDKRDRDRQPNSNRRQSTDYRDIVFESRADAEDVLEKLLDAIDQYGAVSLVDLYSAAGITSNFTDDKFGWEDLSEARAVRIRGGGYILDMPRPIALD